MTRQQVPSNRKRNNLRPSACSQNLSRNKQKWPKAATRNLSSESRWILMTIKFCLIPKSRLINPTPSEIVIPTQSLRGYRRASIRRHRINRRTSIASSWETSNLLAISRPSQSYLGRRPRNFGRSSAGSRRIRKGTH